MTDLFFNFDDDTTKKSELELLVEDITEDNRLYRLGKPRVTDKVYDKKLERLCELDPQHSLLKKVGMMLDPKDPRKEKLEFIMGSLDKLKSLDAVKDWMIKKGIPMDTILCITSKYDGLTIENNVLTGKAWTGGDGFIGRKSEQHLADICQKYKKYDIEHELSKYNFKYIFTLGEVIMHKNIFKRYAKTNPNAPNGGYENGRNCVSGLLIADYDDKYSEILKDCLYQRYTLITDKELDKSLQLDILNKYFNGYNPVHYKLMKFSEMTTENMRATFDEWSVSFELDGLVIDVNDATLRKKIGLESNGLNPGYARAYKANFEERGITKVNNLNWEISKFGNIIPVVEVDPIRLDGAIVSRVSGNNARQILNTQVGVGAVVEVIRSGMVIPLITKVITPAIPSIPTHCPSCNSELVWNTTIDPNYGISEKVHLCCKNSNCKEIKIQKIVSFFSTLEASDFGEPTIRSLYERGYDTLLKIFTITINELKTLPGFGESKANIVYDTIHNCITNVSLNKVMHASNLFPGLGSKKLALVEHYTTKPSIAELKQINGFSDITAKIFIDGYDEFYTWLANLPMIIIGNKLSNIVNIRSDKYKGQTFCFTKIRDKFLEQVIIENSGTIVDSVNKDLTYLVCKEIGGGSSKEVKATKLGVTVIDINQLKDLLNK